MITKGMSREEKQAFKAYRSEVVGLVESLRGQIVDGSERRALSKKPFNSFALSKVHREIVEVLADFVTAHGGSEVISAASLQRNLRAELAPVRALWYLCTMFRPRANSVAGTFDAYEMVSSKDVFGFDIRSLRNVGIVFETLLLYLREGQALFPDKELDHFVGSNSSQLADVQLLLRLTSAESLLTIRRVADLATTLTAGNPELLHDLAAVIAPVLIRSETSTTEASNELRVAAFEVIVSHAKEIFLQDYVSTKARLGQGLLYTPKFLKQNELETMLEGSTLVKYAAGDVVIEQNQPSSSVFYVRSGVFAVFVGTVKVATLIGGDWFGESSLVGACISRARVVCEKKGGEVNIMSAPHLGVLLSARPDLAATFFSIMAYELALRVNVALIKLSRSTSEREDISADAKSGRHVIRSVQMTRPRDEYTETSFRFEADIHAVKAYKCRRVPKELKKTPRDAILFVFSTRIAILYQKGHHQKNTMMSLKDLQTVRLEGDSDLVIEYLDGKKHKTARIRFASNAELQKASSFVEAVRATFRGQSPAVPNFSLVTAVAMFPFAPDDESSQLPLAAGNSYTVIDRCGEWLYGFDANSPDRKGLFPMSFVDLRPHGVFCGGCMQPADWKALDFAVVQEMKKGDTVVQEGDATQVGHIFFLRSGELTVSRKLANGLAERLNTLHPGESMGELLFLLGGFPRASVTVDSETAEVVVVNRLKLSAMLHSNPAFASPFWKHLCAILFSRLNHLQLRLAKSLPPVPPPVRLVLPESQQQETRPSPPSVSPIQPQEAANVACDIPSAVDVEAQHQLISQLKDLLSDQESSEGDADE